jgi:hypothetical protein
MTPGGQPLGLAEAAFFGGASGDQVTWSMRQLG